MNSHGWCKLSELLTYLVLTTWSEDEVRFVIEHSSSHGCFRFELDDAGKWVRATGGHSICQISDGDQEQCSRTGYSFSKDVSTQTPSQAPVELTSKNTQHEAADACFNIQQSSTHRLAGAHDETLCDAEGQMTDAICARPDDHEHDAVHPAAETDRDSMGEPQQHSAYHEETHISAAVLGLHIVRAETTESSIQRPWKYVPDAHNKLHGQWMCTVWPFDSFHTETPMPWEIWKDPNKDRPYWWNAHTEEWFWIT